jgi:hypothetical protein
MTTESNDQIYQEFKLYIEGVQVPFISISLNQAIGTLPQATIVIPPMVGLMDIARFYQPKVHIFFTERPNGSQTKAIEKVLFTGIIIGSTYSKSKEGNSGSVNISFTCAHKYSLITECLIDYCGAIRDGGTDLGGSNASSGLTDIANSSVAITSALAGWVDVGTSSPGPLADYSDLNPTGPRLSDKTESRTDVLPSNLAPFANRLKGMPGVFINYWNQLNRSSFNPDLKNYQGGFRLMYKPLIEDGLGFFRRLTGHMFIENLINRDKVTGCGHNGDKSILVPPQNQIFLKSSIQANMTIGLLQTYLQNSNEVTNLYSMFQNFYRTIEYDILTLSSPAEVILDPNRIGIPGAATHAVDTIVKPELPFYFSPACNVLYPSMYTSISINYDELSMPTRLDILNYEDGGYTGANGTHFRTPASIRSAIGNKASSDNPTLSNTTGPSYGAIGKYEMGRGMRYETMSMPNWLSSLITSSKVTTAADSKDEQPALGSAQDQALEDLKAGWALRYPNPKDAGMNPWDKSSKIEPHQRILFATADYYYTKKFASTKAGNITCLFNPYIIPGYPMDVLDSSPNLPSFHGLCVAVSHNISASGLSTQVSMAAAMTYTELANYYIPFVNPYLQVSLGLAKNPTLVNTNSAETLNKANEFYKPTLGVTAVSPEMIFDFSIGRVKSVKMSSSGLVSSDNRELISHSFEDDLLTLCKRPIESKKDYADRFDLAFIDMVPENYVATGVKYQDPHLSNPQSNKFEIGQSQFLEYSDDIHALINASAPKPKK